MTTTPKPSTEPVGEHVEWWCVPRGGYGYGFWVPAIVRRDKGHGWVVIDALRKDGTYAVRTVKSENLRRGGAR